MPLTARPEMHVSLRYLGIAMILLVAVLGLAVCAEGLCSQCAHVCCGGADRSRPLVHLGHQLAAASASAAAFALGQFSLATRGMRLTVASYVPTPPLLKVSALRI